MITAIWRKLKKRELLSGLILVGIVLSVVLVMFMAECKGKVPEYATHTGYDGEEQVIYYLTDNDTIVQEFSSPQDFDMASLHFSDHDQSIQGKTFIHIIEKETGAEASYIEKSNVDIHYGNLVEIDLESGGKAGTTYVLSIKFEKMGEKGLGIFGTQIGEDRDSAFLKAAQVNGEEKEYSVLVGTHTYTQRFKRLVVYTFFMAAVILLVSVFLVTQTGLGEEYLFLGIAVPMGIALLMYVSVNIVHDGPTHLAKVYHYSNILLGRGNQDQRGSVLLYGDEAEAFAEWYDGVDKKSFAREMYWNTLQKFGDKRGNTELIYSHPYRESNASSFFEYFPGIAGMTLGRILGGSARLNILIAKIFFFLFYILTVFAAIKISPHFKTVIAFTALLPMSMYQASGITYDSVVLAISILVFALFIRARENAPGRKEIVLLFGLSAILGCCKGGFYLLLILLFVTIPAEIYGSMKKKYLVCLGAIGAGGVGVVSTYLGIYLPEIKKVVMRIGTDSQTGQTQSSGTVLLNVVPETKTVACGVGYLFEKPLNFARMFVNTLVHEADSYIGSLVGHRMAWSDHLVPWIVITAFLILILLAASDTDERSVRICPREKIWALILLSAEFFGFHVLMLVETPIGAGMIKGVQGRYFLAWVPVAMFILYSSHRQCDKKGVRRLFVSYSVAEVAFLYTFLKIFLGIQ